MRASRYNDAAPRESVFTRPAHLDALVASLDDPGNEWDRCSRRESNASVLGGGNAVDAGMLEEAQREVEVLRLQNEHVNRQLKGAMAELALHKRHAEEFKRLLETAEADLVAAHETTTDLSQRLQLAQEGNRRNADMAQQLLTHLNTTRVELKAQTLRNAQLEQEREEGRSSSSAAGMEGAAVQHHPASTQSLYSGITSRAALVPVTHDVGVQVDTKPTGPASSWDAVNSRAAMIALKHAHELEKMQSGSVPQELAMEARPDAEKRSE